MTASEHETGAMGCCASSKVTIDGQGPVSDEEEAKHKYKALANTRAEDWKLPPPGDPR